MSPPPRASQSEPLEQPLDLDGFIDPDDQGLSLDELSRAYAAILSKGADPYPEAERAERARSIEPPAPLPAEAAQPEDDQCEIVPKTILEAMLFVGHPANEPLASERIATLMRGVRPDEIDDLVAELNAQYAQEGCPYTIISVDLGYQLALKPEFAQLRDVFYGTVREARLSQSAIDVLAIVAYQQPITQPEIDRLRGKPTGSILAQLVRRDLLTLVLQSEKSARPVYRTTDRFLDLFDLDELSDLPRSQEIERDL
ncbi:MAG: SMC-Scp complex subunit ScpB [Planctomycetaceae bacterium]|nr:SMC-Scp complex subunit ScpB [Planctomycetaceae bacterium]